MVKCLSVDGAAVAMEAIRSRSAADRQHAAERWQAAVGTVGGGLHQWGERFRQAGRLTLNFHPDRVGRQGVTVARGLLDSGRYRSQWVTGLSAGSRSAIPGGERHRFERELFHHAYDHADPDHTELPVYGALDLVFDPHGGSPRFGSSFVVVHRRVLDRTTLCVGDSHRAPPDVGTMEEPWSILAGLAEQAAGGELLNRGLGVDVLLRACDGSFRSPTPSRDLDGYIEAQVHGGVSLETDVESIVLDPSFRDTSVEEDLRVAAGRYGFSLLWHAGSELGVDEVPTDFRGPMVPALAREVALPDGVIDAHAIGVRAAGIRFAEPTVMGDHPDSDLQQLKYLWHTLLAHGHDADCGDR